MPGVPRVIAPSDRSIDHPDSAMALCCVAATAASADTTLLPSVHRSFCYVRRVCSWQGDFLALPPVTVMPIWRLAGVHEHPQPGLWRWLIKWILSLSYGSLWGYLVWLQKIVYLAFTTFTITHSLIVFLLLWRKHVILQGVCWSGVLSQE